MASLANVHISKNCINNTLIMSLMIFKKIYLRFQEVKYLHSRLNIDMEIIIYISLVYKKQNFFRRPFDASLNDFTTSLKDFHRCIIIC
jgi:hypothetical protein